MYRYAYMKEDTRKEGISGSGRWMSKYFYYFLKKLFWTLIKLYTYLVSDLLVNKSLEDTRHRGSWRRTGELQTKDPATAPSESTREPLHASHTFIQYIMWIFHNLKFALTFILTTVICLGNHLKHMCVWLNCLCLL